MKKVMKLAYLLMGVALLLSSCSEDIFPGGSESNEDVTISLAYSDVSPRDIVVNSRATPEEERHLNNLYIYIFDGNGNLKGYKGIEGEENLNQNTSSTTKAEITGIKTRSGESYIYAVANISSTGLYPVETSSGTVAANKLPINLNEETARAGGYDFTLDQLKALTFKRSDTSIDITSAFLMSGAVKEGNPVNITTAGAIAGDDNAIRLSRIVSKVKFTIKAADNTTGVTRSFKLETYDIMNIAVDGSLVGKIDGNSRKKPTTVSNDIGNTVRPNDVEAGAQIFEVYLPENLQDAVNKVTTQAEREDDSQSTPTKVFTNAPAYGTYVMLKGKYEETTSNSTKSADVTYYVHLGDCTNDVNNYDVERNCKYTYKITVAGVDKIIVEAKREGADQPGAEGVVLEYGATGKNMTLDSHYEYMVMRFYQNNIQDLKKAGKGYFYQVYALGNHTDVINVGATTVGKNNGVDTSWIQFAIKCSRDGSSSTYSTDKTSRGTACSYPGTKYASDLYTVEDFLKYLYDNANSTSIWTGSDSKGNYVDATCFISENYYKNLTWNQYVNDVDKRAFYVANEVEASKDGRSVYAKTQYGLTQYNIQTFYDRSKARSITAYGCETINDEEGKGFTVNGGGNKYNSAGTVTWNGRTNMVADINKRTDTWENLKNNKSLIKACMSRNRDLNGDGKISDDEIRWYAPTISQYIGIWIGEEIMSTEAKLFNKATSTLQGESDRMLYYSSTNDENTYFSEEGLATYNYTQNSQTYSPKLVRCLRNLKSNDVGYNQTPDMYYTYKNSVVTLDNVDEKALLTSGGAGELNAHTERSELNKPAKQFQIASNTYVDKDHYYYNNGNYVWTTQKQIVEDGTVKCYGKYSEGGSTNWRVPNQRELSLMFLVDKAKIQDTYCRTKFSYPDFRKSWTYSGGVFTMDVSKWNATGSIRCIKVLK